MSKVLAIGAAVVGLSGMAWAGMATGDGSPVPYPDGYRSWQHLKTMLILPGHALTDPFGGIHHVYANAKAMQGLETGTYPDGSVLVFDLLAYEEGDNVIVEGARKLVGVMHRDNDAYAKTGGWGFEGFAGDSETERLVSDDGVSCFGCHESVASSVYVFAKYRP